MTADIGRLIFCLGLIFASLSSHGDCKDVPVDANQPFKATEAKLTKPIVAAGAVAGADEYSPVVEGARYDTQLPISVADVNDTSNSVTHSSGRIGKDDPTTRSSIHAAKPSKTFGSDDGFAEEVKKRLPDTKAKSKKTQEFESETDDGKGKQTDPKSRPRRPEIEDVEPTTKSDKPTIPSSRGKLKFQLDNSIGENGRSATAPPESGRVEDVSKLPLVKPNDSTSSNNDFSFTGSNGDVDAKTNRSAKSSFHYQGGDGYTFENQFAIDADRDDIKYEDKISTYPIHDPGNNIDRVRNFNENTGNVKLKNIVRKPQGFTLTTESTSEADVLRKTVTRFSATAGKRRFTESPIYVPKTEPVTDASSTAISKNEIVRKPSMKPSSTFSNRRRGPSSTTALNDNSLPTTSTAWALASLKPPASAKVQKRPSLELLKKNVAEVPQPMFVTTMKPFKSWSTKLMKTTTESATDIPTTMKPLAEVEAETLSPIAFSDPKLMNVSDIQSPNPMAESSKAVVEEAARNETTDIRIDLVEDTHKSPPTEGANSSHVKEIVDSTRYNYVVGNSSDDKNDTLITLNIHDADDTGKHVAVDEIKNSKNEIDAVPKPSAPKYNIPQADEPVKIQTTSTTERIRDVGLLNDVKSPSESNDFRNTTQAPVTSEAPRIDYQNTESNTIFDQIYKVKDHKEVVKEADTVTKNTSESNAVNGIDIGVQMVTKNLDPSEPSSGENSTKVVHGVEAVSEDGNREAATDASPMYDIEIDDDGSRTTGAVNETVVVDIKDIQANNVSTTTTTTTMEPETELPWATIPTLKLTPKTESLEDTMTTTRRTSPKRVYSTPAIMTLRPSTTMEMITVTNVPADEVTTFTSVLSSLRPTEVAGIFFKRKNTKLSPAPPRVSENTIVDELTTAAAPAVTETRRKYSRPTTTESIEETTSKAPPIVLPSSTETVDAVTTLPDRRSSSEVPLIGSSTPADVTVVIDTTFPAVEDLPMGTFKPKLSPENVPAYLMLIFKSSFAYICQTKAALKENLFQYITERSARVQSKEQVIMVVDPEQCKEPDDSPRLIPVALYVVDDVGSYDKTLIDEMQAVLDVDNLNNYTIPIHKIVYQPNFVPDNSRVIAAMIITSIAAVCFVLLIFLMCTIRNRQKLSYGQRCTPVSVDDYNLDNISEYNNSVRRKGAMRASKRSYGNPAFDDPLGPSKNLTYNGLIKANENRCALDEEFSQIPVITVKPEELPAGAENKNRYANVIPLPETRVSLSNSCSDSVQDYINANYVKGFKGADRFYIACQAPLQNNIDDFWKMIWKEQSKVIIMLTGLSENGVEKCADYLPPSEVLDCHRLFGDYQVTLKKREVKEKYVISSLQLKNLENNLWREVTHLWYTNWPAQGVPSEQSSIIALLIEARAYMRNATGPHVVHCSPGTGRTGTVIACDICIRDYEMTRSVNIPLTVAKLRRCRAGAVQTKEQYAFIYKVLTLYAKKLNGGTPLESL